MIGVENIFYLTNAKFILYSNGLFGGVGRGKLFLMMSKILDSKSFHLCSSMMLAAPFISKDLFNFQVEKLKGA